MKLRRFGQVGRLKPDKIAQYRALHANAWPGVLKTITACNLRNYSIFIHGDLVFSYFEYAGDDYDADMEKMAMDPVTQEWWKHTKPCFEKFAMDPGSEFYHDMESIFFHDTEKEEPDMGYGKKVWIFPDAELPPVGVNAIPGHESVIITNVSDQTAHVKFTLIYVDRDPVSFTTEVAAMRVRCLRTNREEDFGPYTAAFDEQYAIMLESDVPIVAQYGRAEPRAVNFYTTPGYCE